MQHPVPQQEIITRALSLAQNMLDNHGVGYSIFVVPKNTLTPERVIELVFEALIVDKKYILGKSNAVPVFHAKCITTNVLLKLFPEIRLLTIAHLLGGHDHTSAFHWRQRSNTMMTKKPNAVFISKMNVVLKHIANNIQK